MAGLDPAIQLRKAAPEGRLFSLGPINLRGLARFVALKENCWFNSHMSVAAINADAFATEVCKTGAVWAIRDGEGFPTSTNHSGECAMPFWSSEARARRVIEGVATYRTFEPFRIDLLAFVEHWLPGLEKDGLLAGLNWSGQRAVGYDMAPRDVHARLVAVGHATAGASKS